MCFVLDLIYISITMSPYVLWPFGSLYFFCFECFFESSSHFSLWSPGFFLLTNNTSLYSKYLAVCISVCWEYTMISPFTGFLMLLVIEVNYGF